MAGIYLHIPFCKSKCHYCNFYSLASLRHKDAFQEALLKEIVLQKDYLAGEEIESIYFGGGTPSLLSARELASILNEIHKYFPVQAGAEIDLEANPDDINLGILQEWKKMGINRLSIGTQAFDDALLKKLNRVHTAKQALNAVQLARENTFENISIDLIYGIPGLTDKQWSDSIRRVMDLQIPHISAYHLTVETGTALEVLIRKGKYPQPDEEAGVGHFRILMHDLQRAGYEHYEISNFALPGCYSRHNSNYWKRKKYLGLGPSAHSFDGRSRQWNVASVRDYMQALQEGRLNFESEQINPDDAYNEFVMLGLRTQDGVDAAQLEKIFGPDKRRYFESGITAFIDKNQVLNNGTLYRLSEDGKLFADGIAGALFV
jgi:oxygen-independent coproporphyrinogen-3 oxidase